jgi:hypothetical protein
MATRTARRRSVRTRRAARQAANSKPMAWLARAGFAARGVMYILIGIIAVEIAIDGSHQQAQQSGAVRLVARTPLGSVLLWLLVAGFAGMTLWRLSEAIWGSNAPDGHKFSKRAGSLACAVLYGAITFGILKYALGVGQPSNSDHTSQDLTATALKYPGGQVIVAIVGAGIVVAGLVVIYLAWRRKFAQNLRLDSASPATRRAVLWIGEIGGIARGIVFGTVGVFLFIAALDAKPSQAKGVDSALRALAHTPLGPWLLLVVALGLVIFGLYSWCEARWRVV